MADYSPQKGDSEYLDINATKDDGEEYLDVAGSLPTQTMDANRAHIRMVDFGPHDGMDLDQAQSYVEDDTRSQMGVDLDAASRRVHTALVSGRGSLQPPVTLTNPGPMRSQLDLDNPVDQNVNSGGVFTAVSEPLPELARLDLDEAALFANKILDEPNGRLPSHTNIASNYTGQVQKGNVAPASLELDALDQANLSSLDIVIDAIDPIML